MRSIWRTLGPDLSKDIALLLVADTVVAASFGAICTSAGLPVWVPAVMSVVVFAGASQFLFIGVLTSGGHVAAAVLAGILVNLRLVPLGMAVADVMGHGPARRVIGAVILTDESAAFALSRPPGSEQRRLAYWVSGIGLFLFWNLGVLAGAYGGEALGDVERWGLDAAFPAVLLALIAPALRERRTAVSALVGTAIALAATPFLPAGIPVLLALVAVILARPAVTR